MLNHKKLGFFFLLARKLLSPRQAKRLANYGGYRLLMPFVRRWGPDKLPFKPLSVLIAVTARCNKHCSFCFFDGELNQGNLPELELDIERFLKIIEHPTVTGSLRIGLTGGEPFLNKNLFGMIREAQRRNHIVSIITNGTLIQERASELLADPPDLLSASYYPEEKEKLSEGLSLIAGAVPLHLHFVLSQNRVKDLESFFQTAVKFRARAISVKQVHFPDDARADKAALPSLNDFQALRKNLEKKYGKESAIFWWLPAESPKRRTRCLTFWRDLHVDARGDISPCCEWRLSTYRENLFKNGGAWNSHQLVSLRTEMRRNRPPEACRNCASSHEDPIGI